jgi:transcriptional regulator with XRE-family HTH domain
MTFGQAVSSGRKAKQLSQKQLAALIIKEDGCPISPQYLNDIERDRRNPPGDLLISQLARALGIPEEYFFYLAHQIPPQYRTETAAAPWQIQAAFQAFARSYKRTGDGQNNEMG